MNQDAASPQELCTVKLPEDYYSKPSNSYWYDYRLIDQSFNDEKTPTEKFIDSIYDQLPIKAPNHSSHKKKKALNNIICSLLNAYKCNRMLNISRDKTNYSIPKQYGMDHCTYTFIIINGIDALDKANYIYQEKGYYDIAKEQGEITKICATEKFINEYYNFSNLSDTNFKLLNNKANGANIICIEPRFKKLKFAIPILLKNQDKKLIRYLPLRKVRRMRDNLNDYNSLLSHSRVITPYTTIPDNQILPLLSNFYDKSITDKELSEFNFYCVLDTYLYRVFNKGAFNQGGRFYGAAYQRLNGDKRKSLLINEYPTVECDYKAIHPRLCYHQLGIEYQDDPYSVVCGDGELREPTKKLMNMMICVDRHQTAANAFKEWLTKEEGRREVLNSNNLDERKLMGKILNAHQTINRFFNSGIGVKFQYLDSCIAEAVLMHFTKQGIPCLCVHDSFIIDGRYKDELSEVMKEEYKRLIGFNCKIDFK